ncbi:hypothetical protein Tco_0381217 [Tanacetum coccineum]
MLTIRLKIKLSKSRIFSIGIHMDDVANIARAINCSYGSLPFNYLELLVGKRMNKVDAWNGVVGKLSERPATWKINLLFIGGRRQPHGYALDDLSALTSLINGLVHDMSREDYWSWSLDKSGSFSVRSLCKIIQSNLFVIETKCPSFKWNFLLLCVLFATRMRRPMIIVYYYVLLSRAFCLKYGFSGVLPSLLTALSGTSFLEISTSLKTNE